MCLIYNLSPRLCLQSSCKRETVHGSLCLHCPLSTACFSAAQPPLCKDVICTWFCIRYTLCPMLPIPCSLYSLFTVHRTCSCAPSREGEYISSVAWSGDGAYLAVSQPWRFWMHGVYSDKFRCRLQDRSMIRVQLYGYRVWCGKYAFLIGQAGGQVYRKPRGQIKLYIY